MAAQVAPKTIDKEVVSTALALTKAAETLNSAVAQANGIIEKVAAIKDEYATTAQQLAQLKTEKQAEISGLAAEFAEKERVGKLDVDLNLKEYGLQRAISLVSQTHSVVTKDDYTRLTRDAAILEEEKKKEVAAAVGSTVASYKAQIAELNSTQRVETAEIKAQLTNKDNQIVYLEKQVASLEKMIADERSASIERAKAATPIQNFTTPSGK